MAPWYELPISRRGFLTVSGMAMAAAAVGCTGTTLQPDLLAQRVPDKAGRPVVVIGAGLGGLTAAAYLATRGFPVTLVEQHDIPGGYATSFDRAQGRFTFEVSLHQTAARSGATRRVLEELGLAKSLPLAPAPEFARILQPDLELVLPAADPAGCVEALARQFPGQRQGIAAYIGELVQVAEEVKTLPDKMGLLDYMSFPTKHALLWDLRKLSMEQFLGRHLQDPRLKDLLSVYWGYYGLPPAQLSGFLYAVATGDYLKNGGYYYLPRSQALSDALAQLIAGRGGQIIYENAVQNITMEQGAVSGVILADGRRLPARAVIANAAAPTVFGRMLPPQAAPEEYRRKLSAYRPSLSSFVVWLGLKRSLRGQVPGYGYSLGAGLDAQAEYQASLGGDAGQVGLGVALYDNLSPDYSRPGSGTMTITFVSGYEPWRRFEADYLAGRKAEYLKEKERVASVLVERVAARLIPGLRDMIEVQEVATPLTNLRFTRNPEGAIYGFEQSLDNAYMNRLPNRTPVKGLYLASSWGNPGGGFTGAQMAGRDAFLRLMEDWTA